MGSLDMGMQAGGGDLATQMGLVSDMVLDPRMGLPLYGIKNEKEQAESPAPFALTPRMFDAADNNNTLDYGSIYGDAMSSDAATTAPPALVAAPERNRTTPSSPPSAASATKLKKPRDGSGKGKSGSAVSLAAADSQSSPPPSKCEKPPKKKPKTRSKTDLSETAATSGGRKPKQDAKRSRCLERNRIAASKCREKKKQWVHELEATKDELESRHASLQREYSGLLDEATQIKTSLMAHAVCNDRNIDMWIESEAVRFVRRSNRRHQQAAAGGIESRHSSIASLASLNSQNESVAQSSTTAPTEDTQLSPPGLKADLINFDYMPDDMFADAG
ncbi:bZIP transcription factor [Hirsutella rhossiliensis]|uniref:BZIP transcription factor domain-containing protein n=1 Tax=Hirsutella rhossiliensis TaxID=111463 RepID=A0A9P8MMG6_9HYPO|nr:bZIP transcription factor domain-containing protein [Hirsutella rhossiliensis]KAH0957089.1 bZIP transcription factor domain-containing protein [Hirsutella rhossiliensis]